jgi:hypothetical protein
MKALITRRVLACCFLLLVSKAWGQGSGIAVVEYSSGDDIIVIRQGKRIAIKDPIGLELFQGDQVQTGKAVFMEMRLYGGGAVLKLAENTTFILERLTDGQTSLQLVYGRIRAKVEKLAGTDSFSVRSTQAVAGVRGTDFGLDVITSRTTSSATTTRAYCFEGSVEVIAYVRSDVLAAEALEPIPKAFVIAAGEMVQVEGETGKTEAVKSPVDQSIREFWVSNDYVAEPSVLAPVAGTAEPNITASVVMPAETPAGAPEAGVLDEKESFTQGYTKGYEDASALYKSAAGGVPEGFVSEEELVAIRRTVRWQKGSLMAGTVFGLGGAALALYGFSLVESGDDTGGIDFLRYGAIASAVSLPFLVMSLFSTP